MALARRVVLPAETPFTVTVPLDDPSGIETVAGDEIDAICVASLATVTSTPPAGAGSPSVTVAVTLRPTPIGSELGSVNVSERGIRTHAENSDVLP